MSFPKTDDGSQSAKFRKTARELGCDPSEERFNAALKTVARHKPVEADSTNKPGRAAGQKKRGK